MHNIPNPLTLSETEKQQFAEEFQEANQDAERNHEIEIWDSLIGEEINAMGLWVDRNDLPDFNSLRKEFDR